MPALRRKPFIALAVLLGLSLPCSLRADVVEIDGIQWTYSVANGEAMVEGIPTSTAGDISIPQKLGGCDVTTIGGSAFRDCTLLTAVSIPRGTRIIGPSAFYGCSGLLSVSIPNDVKNIGDYTFYSCSSLTEITIPNGVTNIGSSAFCLCSGLSAIEIPDSVITIGRKAFDSCFGMASLTFGNGVTSIDSAAFYGCKGLTEISIPNNVTNLGGQCFEGCQNLRTVSIFGNIMNDYGNGSTSPLFYRTGVTTVILGGNMTKIGSSLLSGLKIESITIPEGVISIGDYAFSGCNLLTSVVIPDSVTSMGVNVFNGCNSAIDRTSIPGILIVDGWAVGSDPALSGVLDLTGIRGVVPRCCENRTLLTEINLPNSLTNIGDLAFRGCSGLTSISIPTSVTSIGSWFYNCSGLTSITIPAGVTSIGSSAFSGCSALTSITIPASVTSIGQSAFSGCSALTSITIPDRVTSIGGSAFYGCSKLTSVSIPDSVTSIGTDAFKNCRGVKDIMISGRFRLLTVFPQSYGTITNVVLASGTTSIGDQAFYSCSGLTSVTIPNGVESIGDEAFYSCSGLTSVTIPNGVESIGNEAFYKCSGLVSITIPASVISIGNSAFSACSNLKDVRLSDIAAWCAISFGDYASPFYYASNLYIDGNLISDLVIPDGVMAIGAHAFYNCDCLRSVSIPDSVETIGDQAFGDCDNIAGVRVPQCVMTKGLSSVFRRSCAKITSLQLGADVSTIGANEFNGFNALTSISVEAGNDDFVVSADGCLYDADRKTLYVCPRNATQVELPDGLEIIAAYAFTNCKKLSGVVFPDNVANLPTAAFNGCDALWTAWYRSLSKLSAGGGSGGGDTTRISFTATNVVLHYVASAVPSGAVTPPTAEGLVNVVTEIGASRAIAVSSDWAAQYPGFENLYGTDFGAAIVAENGKTDGAGHPMFVWQDYVAGTDPTDPADAFTASIAFDATTGDPVIGWSPELPAAEAAKRVYTVFGKVRLNDESWTEVDGDAADYNFFKVRVEMK